MWIGYWLVAAACTSLVFTKIPQWEPAFDDDDGVSGRLLRSILAITCGAAWPLSLAVYVVGWGIPSLYGWIRRKVAAKKTQKPVNTENG